MISEPSNPCEICKVKIRELEIRIIGLDGKNGLTGRIQNLEDEMNQSLNSLFIKLDSMTEAHNDRLRQLEMRVYLICGIPAIVAATVATLKLLHITQ